MNVTVGTATVTREIEIVAHRYETASAYDRLRLIPGTYDLYSNTGCLPYVYRARIEAVRLEHVYISRLFSASSIDRDTTEQPDAYHLDVYDHGFGVSGEVVLREGAIVLRVEPAYRRWRTSPQGQPVTV